MQIDRDHGVLRRARQRLEIAHDVADALRAFPRDVEPAERSRNIDAAGSERVQVFAHELECSEDVRERVVDLVPHRRGDPPQRRQPIGGGQLGVDTLSLAQIVNRGERDDATFVRERHTGDLDRNRLTRAIGNAVLGCAPVLHRGFEARLDELAVVRMHELERVVAAEIVDGIDPGHRDERPVRREDAAALVDDDRLRKRFEHRAKLGGLVLITRLRGHSCLAYTAGQREVDGGRRYSTIVPISPEMIDPTSTPSLATAAASGANARSAISSASVSPTPHKHAAPRNWRRVTPSGITASPIATASVDATTTPSGFPIASPATVPIMMC